MKKIIYILILIFPIIDGFSQYNPNYSQYMFNGLLINPAYTGTREVLSFTLLSRNQWMGIEGSPRTQSFSADMPINKKRIGLGISMLNDEIGVSRHSALFLNYSYIFKIDDIKRLSLGISGGVDYLKSEWTELELNDDNDIVFNEDRSYTKGNFGAGIYYYDKKNAFGFSCPEFLKYSEDDYYDNVYNIKPYNFFLYGSRLISISQSLKSKPSVLAKIYPGKSMQMDINCNFIYNRVFWAGLSVRTEDAIIFMIQYQLTTGLRLGLAYDFTFSPLQKYSSGSSEIMLKYEFNYKTNAVSPKFF